VSLSIGRVEALVEERRRGARALYQLKRDPSNMLTTILIGNNVVNIAASVLATVVATRLFGDIGPGIAVGVLTVAILIFDEITPKSLATRYSERISLAIAPPMLALMRAIYPFVWLLGKFTTWVHGAAGIQHDPTITPDGTLLVFDNGSHHPLQGRSRVVEVDMKTNDIIWQYLPSPVFSMLSLHIAGAERLPNGNTLICEGESGRVFEVTKGCEICWEWNSPFVHDFKGIPAVMLFRAHRYATDGPELGEHKLEGSEFDELNEKWGLNGKYSSGGFF